MAEHEFWRGERGERWRVMDEMEDARAARYRQIVRGNDEGRGGEAGPHRGRGPKGYRRSDARILEDVSERLTDDPRLDASEIEVEVQDGEVTLKGRVADREARRRAEDLAMAVSGVRHVMNHLRAG